MKKVISLLLLVTLLVGMVTVGEAAKNDSMLKSAVAYMKVKYKCGCSRTGSGTMVAVNGLITCAHNLVCADHNKGVDTCNFYFGRTGKNKYSHKYTGKFTYRWYGDFSGSYSSADDIAYVVFPEDVGKKTGWFASSAESDDDLKWEFCHMSGHDSREMVFDWSQIEVVDSKRISWTMSNAFRDCMEGGPVYYDSDDMDYPTVVAVYTSHNGSTGYARRLTKKIYDDMKSDGVKFN